MQIVDIIWLFPTQALNMPNPQLPLPCKTFCLVTTVDEIRYVHSGLFKYGFQVLINTFVWNVWFWAFKAQIHEYWSFQSPFHSGMHEDGGSSHYKAGFFKENVYNNNQFTICFKQYSNKKEL